MDLHEWLPPSWGKRYLAVAALLLIGLGYAGGRYLHQSRADLTTFEERLESLYVRNGAARTLVESGVFEAAGDSIALYLERLRAAERLIPSSEELPDLLDAIAIEAQASAVDLNFLQPIEVVREGDYSRRTYAVGVLGGYHEVGQFLTSIASLPRIVTPADLMLASSGEVNAAGTPVLDARLVIETYVTSNPPTNALQNP